MEFDSPNSQEQKLTDTTVSGQVGQSQGDLFQIQNSPIQVFIYPNKLKPEQFQNLSGFNKAANYIRVLFFLIRVLILWFILGFFAQSAFPIDYVWSIILETLQPYLKDFSKDQIYPHLVKTLIDQREKVSDPKKLDSLVRLFSSFDKAKKLNQHDSKQWLLFSLLSEISKDIKDENLFHILSNLEELASERQLIEEDLKKLKQIYYPKLVRFQKVMSRLTSNESKDQQAFDSIVSRVFIKYIKNKEKPTLTNINEVIALLQRQQGKFLSPNYRKNLIQISAMLEWIASAQRTEFAGTKIRAWKERPTYHSDPDCKYYPKVEKEGDEAKIDEYNTALEAENNKLEHCKNCEAIRDRKCVT